jgi:RNA polymerase sigma factor (sigma-70 family)
VGVAAVSAAARTSSDATTDPVDNVRPFPRLQRTAPPTDAELLRRCRAQDGEAWQQLVDRYERLIYTVALRNGLSAEDAADVTQITFVALLDSLDRMREEERLASWLMTVARRQAWRVRNLTRRSVSLEAAPEPSTDPSADWDTLATLHDALGTLGGSCRELLLALYFDPAEPSYVDLAERFGRAVGGIGPMRGRCLARLRELMSEGEAS